MNNVVQLKNQTSQPSDATLDQASEWISKMDRGLDQDETLALQQWMAQDANNKQLLLNIARLYDDMETLGKLKDLFPEPSVSPQPKTPVFALAASFMLASLLLFFSLNWTSLWSPSAGQNLVLSEQSFQTGVGESQQHLLPDGSEILLNTDSVLEVTYTAQQRVLQLSQGELHVKVSHDSERPLTVYAEGQVMQAVGTAFNVEISNGSVELIVTEGIVRIAEQDASRADPIRPERVRLPEDMLALSQGEAALLGAGEPEVQPVPEQELSAMLSWHQGELVFRGEPLAEVLNEVSRYNQVEFELAQSGMSEIAVAGLFKANDLQGFLTALSRNFDIQSQQLEGQKILLSKKDIEA